jgi:ubiquinone/menaquinone biosynthesis C-methylase UbiE/DNA-binding transcriptional ArsR family regulator
MKETAAFFRLLGDEARLRLLRVLARDRFNVTELTGILGLAQSGISRHLGLLKEAGLVAEERSGAYSYYRLAPTVKDGAPPSPVAGNSALWAVLEAQFADSDAAATVRADEARLQEVLRLRRENFDAHTGPDTRDGRQLVPGRSWAAWSRALGHLMPALDVVDIGCGEGYLTIEAAQWARHVTAIDRSPEVIARAKALGARRRVTNVTWKRGEMEKLPLADDSVDLAVLSQALHHASNPAAAVTEAARVVRPGGHVLILELREHQEAWVREQLGDHWLGFQDTALEAMLSGAQLIEPRITVGSRRPGDPFIVLVASAAKDRKKKPRSTEMRRTAEA